MSHPVVAMAVMIGLLVAVHELGHFIVGRLCGIGVETFSIGFGPAIIKFKHQYTEYRLSWLPLGGYVQFAGMLPGEPVPKHFEGKDMASASPLAQAATLIAGPFANVILTFSVFWFMGFQGVEHRPSIVGEVRPGSPADVAGLFSGDHLTAIAGQKVHTWDDLQKAVRAHKKGSLSVSWLRDDELMQADIEPEMTPEGLKLLGVSYGFLPAVVTVLPQSVAQMSGLQTGAEIQEIRWNEGSREVTRWSDLGVAVFEMYQKKIVDFQVFTKQGQTFQLQASFPQAVEEGVRGRERLLQVLGLQDSQLTVEEIGQHKELLQKDVLLELDGHRVEDLFAVHKFLRNQEKQDIEAKVLRKGEEVLVRLHLKPLDIQLPEGVKTLYVLDAVFYGELLEPTKYTEQYPAFAALGYAGQRTWQTGVTLVESLVGLVTGQVPMQALGGPILIAKVASDSAQAGLQAFLLSLALISMNLAVLNMLPIPLLDGGKLTVVCLEVLTGGPLSDEVQEGIQRVGFALVVSLMVLAFYNDVSRFWVALIR
ncbi:MAG: RIP metalloprotease RseP [Oligoflexales bacterium]